MELHAKALRAHPSDKPIIDRELPAELDKFYERLRATPEVKKFFEGEGHIARAKGAQLGHWASISAGRFDDNYVAKSAPRSDACSYRARAPMVYRGLRPHPGSPHQGRGVQDLAQGFDAAWR